MKLTKDVALLMIGAGAVIAYQKYNKPVMKGMERMFNKTTRMVNDKLDDMM